MGHGAYLDIHAMEFRVALLSLPLPCPALPCPALHADDARGSLLAARCGRAASSEPAAICQLPISASQGEGVAVALENVQTARGRAQLDRPRRDAQANEECQCLLCTTFSSIGIIPYPYVLASGFLIISDCQAKRFIRWMDGWMDGCKFLFYDIGELMLNGH